MDPIGNQHVDEGDTGTLTLTASDPDGDDVNITSSTLEDWMTFDGTTFTMSPAFGDAGTYPVTFTASDGSLTDTETITVTVGDINRPPVLDPIGNKQVQVYNELKFTLTAEDPDDDTLIFGSENLPFGATLNESNGKFSWIPTGAQLGEHIVTFTVEDGNGGFDSETITITVTESPVNNPPVLDPIGDKTVTEGETLNFEVTASDPDEDVLTFEAANLPDGASFAQGSIHYYFRWTPKNGQAGQYRVIFRVDDGNGGSDLETILITVRSAQEGFILNLDKFPYYQSFPGSNSTDDNPQNALKKYSGSAVAKMILTYLWWNKLDNPEGPPEIHDDIISDQVELFLFGKKMNYWPNWDLDRLDVRGLWFTLQRLDPAYWPYHYNWGMRRHRLVKKALDDICYWISYPAGGGSENPYGYGVDGHPVHAPAAVPTGGNYDHWMVVRGIRTTDNPWTRRQKEYGIFGFWVNDPHPEGIGENIYVTAEQWKERYYLPLRDINPRDPNYNKWAAVLEPPAESAQVTVIKPKPRFGNMKQKYSNHSIMQLSSSADAPFSVRAYNNPELFSVIQAAVDGIKEELLPFDNSFAAVYQDSIPGQPRYVESKDGPYYLVPFEIPVSEMSVREQEGRVVEYQVIENKDVVIVDRDYGSMRLSKEKAPENRIVAVALIDAETGAFLEASWVNEPVTYMSVNKNKAIHLVTQTKDENSQRLFSLRTLSLASQPVNQAQAYLQYEEGSRYYPFWKVTTQEGVYMVDQNQKVKKIATEKKSLEEKVTVSESISFQVR